MEYEIAEEGELLHESNNPSLDHAGRRPATPQRHPRKERESQKAVAIPEEAAA